MSVDYGTIIIAEHLSARQCNRVLLGGSMTLPRMCIAKWGGPDYSLELGCGVSFHPRPGTSSRSRTLYVQGYTYLLGSACTGRYCGSRLPDDG